MGIHGRQRHLTGNLIKEAQEGDLERDMNYSELMMRREGTEQSTQRNRQLRLKLKAHVKLLGNVLLWLLTGGDENCTRVSGGC